MWTDLTGADVDGVLAGVRASSYVSEMWHFMLANADFTDDEVPRSEQCDAIPYVPVQPESLGLTMSPGSRILDVGCLGGYGVYDFLMRRQRLHLTLPKIIGIDLDQGSIEAARALAERWDVDHHARFERATCEALPMDAASVHVVIARLVLPYVRLQPTLAEIYRVLAPGGMLLVQTHASRYYAKKLKASFPRARQMLYCARPLMGSMLFSLTGRQWTREMALSNYRLQYMMENHGMERIWQGGFPAKPLFVFRR